MIYLKDVLNIAYTLKTNMNVHSPCPQLKKWDVIGPLGSPGCPLQPCHPSSHTITPAPANPTPNRGHSFSCTSLCMYQLRVYFSTTCIVEFPGFELSNKWSHISYVVSCLPCSADFEIHPCHCGSCVSFLSHGCMVFH